MFRFHKTLDVITLFHRPTIASSVRVLNLLKQASSNAGEAAAQDQASNNSVQTGRQEFELNVTEEPPTVDQLRSILEYVGARRVGEIVKGARGEADAMRMLKQDSNTFQRPLPWASANLDLEIVDWNNGRAAFHPVIGEDESEILKMLETLPKN
ncbi:hypothetical protein FGG08_002479 [Glutinoglossum americanum]|uniref:Uncharacterized protein n=1 Tax=Glutinoglossum americanum TaxID=1670608 RepID=A0A9P8I696_9PEZI|nr:hypothetical protein FGG08_002479 [Glutinoglossum americanum]